MKIPDSDRAKTLGDWSYLAIAKHFRKTIRHESGVLADKDPEELHQMRVGMRRLRSAIHGFAPALLLPKGASEKQVGEIAKVLGNLRDIDVLFDLLKNTYRPLLPTREQDSLDSALEVLARKRKQAFYKVEMVLDDRDYQKLKKDFKNWLDKPIYREIAAISLSEVLPDLLLPQVSNLLLHPGWLVGIKLEEGEIIFSEERSQAEVEKILDDRGKILHELRKEAKRSRYNMELFARFYGDVYHNYVTEVKQIQTIVGEIQDCFVLANFLGDVFESDLKNKLPTMAKKFAEIRYQKWQDWTKLQRQFLRSETKQELRSIVQKPNL
jgi:CHAD domain-containing protein